MVLHRAPTEPEAELWAGACRSVLRELEIASWWHVDVSQGGNGTWLIAVDYSPAGDGRHPM